MTEVDDLRAATREAHEAIKDLRHLMKRCEDLLADIDVAAQVAVDDRIATAMEVGMAAHTAAIRNAILEGEAQVYRRFGDIADILMNEDKSSVRQGKTLKALISEWAVEGTG